MILKNFSLTLSLALLSAIPAVAQAPGPRPGAEAAMFRPGPGGRPMVPQGPRPPLDPLAEQLFPPELIMQNQQAIGLTDEQKSFMKDEIRKSQVRFTELQWQLQDQMEIMGNLLKAEKPNESQVLAQLDKVLAAEREVKRAQFTLILRLKGNLRPEQQAKLRELKKLH